MNSRSNTPPKTKPGNTPEAKAFRKRLRALRKTIGGNIACIRKAENVSLSSLARKTGYSTAKLDYWEMGRMEISLEAILRIAKALKVPHQSLLVAPDRAEMEQEAASEGMTGNKRAGPETLQDDTSDETSDGMPKGIDDAFLMHLLDNPEVQAVRQILVRERQEGGYPDRDTIEAMEHPIRDVFELSLLLSDLVMVPYRDVPFHMRGLSWLASTLRRDAERLYRLYHGRHPQYE